MSGARSMASRPQLWLRDSLTPLYVVNADRRVVLFNRGCEELTGREAVAVLGKRVEALTVGDAFSLEALLASLYPPGPCWKGSPMDWPVLVPHASLPPQPRRACCWPVTDLQGALQALLVCLNAQESGSPGPDEAVPDHEWRHELARVRFELQRRFQEQSLVGQCPAMQVALQLAQLARTTDLPVCLLGESGTGKEHVARTIHSGGVRSRQPFVMLDAVATPGTEITRVLRATKRAEAAGTDHDAACGTLYLSRVELLRADIQQRLLEWLNQPAHDRHPRLLVSANLDRSAWTDLPEVLPELKLRLSSLIIELPPLRQRGDDLLLLTQYFLQSTNPDAQRQVLGVSSAVEESFRRYRWPGNLDELHKIVRDAARSCASGTVEPDDLPFSFRAGVEAQWLGPRAVRETSLDELLEQVEREALAQAIERARGNLTKAAEQLKIPRARLYRRMEQLGLRSEGAAAAESPPPDVS